MSGQSHSDTTHRHEIMKKQYRQKQTPSVTNTNGPDTKQTQDKHIHPSIASVHSRREEMNAVYPQASPPDMGGGGSSTPPGAESRPEVVEVNDSKAVLVITPALVYDMKGEVCALPAGIV